MIIMMDEFVKEFKIEMENFMEEMYVKLEEVVDGALFNMSFYNLDDEENYEKLEAVMMEVIQEQFNKIFGEEL